ncbi:MAG: ATP-dependent 6-phosphofructokinase [Helicobacteraceae bacterium]|nr:ATP-dependent 6-phosphofructokinase [Helicobacteraceae bacterium]
MKRIAILCSGGEASGMNPALKRFVEYSYELNLTPFFIYDGLNGLIDNNIKEASFKLVSGIISRGGTIIRTSRSPRFKELEFREIAFENLKQHNITMLVILGGDGTIRALDIFYKEFNIPFCAIPATIDNDIFASSYSLGVDTALNSIKNSIDSIRDSASSFNRAFVIETMGRECGYLALISAMTSGAEICLIPEVEYDLEKIRTKALQQIKNGRTYFIAVVSEGIKQSSEEIALWFEKELNIEARVTKLGHTQRGGNPTVYDRVMAYKFVTLAIDTLNSNHSSSVICFNDSHFEYKSISEVSNQKNILDQELIEEAKKFN